MTLTPTVSPTPTEEGQHLLYLPLILNRWPQARFYPTADTSVREAAPNENFGSEPDMWVGYDHDGPGYVGLKIVRSLIQFDVSAIPRSTKIAHATLSLYLANVNDYPRTHTVTVHRVIDEWTELSAVWENQPGFAEAYGSTQFTSFNWGRYSLNVTDLVRGWVNGSFPNHGLMVRGPESPSRADSARLGFYTREWGNAVKHPFLEVTYAGLAVEPTAETTSPRAIPNARERATTIADTINAIRGETPHATPFRQKQHR